MNTARRGQQERAAGLAVLLFGILLPLALSAQTAAEALAGGRALYESGQYADAESRLKQALALGPATAELNFLLGMCAAFQGRDAEAEAALSRAIEADPAFTEARVEIGGLYFKQRRYEESAKALRKALELDPDNAYARDLLGTVYFVGGSQDRALAEWNRIGKPVLRELVIAGDGIAHPELLKEELAFRPGRLVRPAGFRESRTRLAKADGFSGISFSLRPSPDVPDQADLLVSGREERGLGPSPAAVLVGGLRDIVHETAYLDLKNIAHRGTHLHGAYRWDPHQRMAELALRAARLFGTPFYYRFGFRERRDEWFFAATDVLGEDEEFAVTRREVRLDVDHILNHRISLDHHLAIERSSARAVSGGLDRDPETRFVWGGDYAFRLAEALASGLSADVGLSYDLSRPFGAGAKAFVRSVLTATVAKTWRRETSPESVGSLTGRVAAGLSSVHTPFDAWFVLGVGPDVDYPLRAYRTTRDGMLGASPLGKSFVLMNVDYLRRIGRLPLVRIDGGIFLDAGRTFGAGPFARPEGAPWKADGGIRLVARVVGVALEISYAHGLTDNRQAFYIRSSLDR